MVFDDAATAKTALNRVKAGEDFAEVAQDLLGWTNDDVTLGLVRRGELDEILGEAAFAANAGDFVGPIETVFGQHVLSIDVVNAGGEQSLEDVSDAIRSTLQAEAAIDLIYQKVNELEDAIASGATLEEAMKAVGGRIDILRDIDRNGLNIDGRAYDGDAADLADDTLVLELVWNNDIDELSVIQEGADDMFFVVEPISETMARGRDLDEVRTRAIADWKRGEAIKAASAKATAIADDTAAFASVDATGNFNRNGIGLDHEAARLIARTVFATDVGKTDIVETGAEAIAVLTTAITPADAESLESTTKLVNATIVNSMRQDIVNILARDLSQTHDLNINLGRVQQILVGSQ
jgi:peptidyl-prolyl cis-trans isomerase D